MVDNTIIPIITDLLSSSANDIAANLLRNTQNGQQISEPLRQLIATLPGINDGTGRWFYEDNFDTDLLTEPQDLDAGDIATIQEKIGNFIREARTPEELETASTFYLHMILRENFNLPEGQSATELAQTMAMKLHLRTITSPNGNTPSVMGEAVGPYVLDTSSTTTLLDPASDDFAGAFGSSIMQIQRDMLAVSALLPEGTTGTIATLGNVAQDKGGTLGAQTSQHLQAYLDFLRDNPTIGDAALRSRAEGIAVVLTLYNALPEEARSRMETKLNEAAVEAPPLSETILAEQRRAEAEARISEEERQSPQHRAGMAVIANAAALFGVPGEVTDTISTPRHIEALPSTHFHEGFRQQMREILSEGLSDIYGVRDPASDDPAARIGGDPDQFRFLADAENNFYEFTTINGVEQLVRIGADNTVYTIDPNNPPVLFEYMIQPDGEISKYLVGSDGRLHDIYPNGHPVVLDAEAPNFDIEHAHFITERFLQKRAESVWERALANEELNLASLFPEAGMPTTAAVNTAIDDAESRIKEALRQYREAQGNPATEEEISALHSSLKSTSRDQFLLALAPADPAQASAADDLYLQILQLQQLENLNEIFATRDFASLTTSGALPGGLTAAPLRFTESWRVDWRDTPTTLGEFPWGREMDYRTFSFAPEIYEAYSANIQSRTPIDAQLFKENPHAVDYIRQMGWVDESGNGSLDYVQTAMVARELMLKESADRHGLESTNSPEARAAFLEDFRSGMYNWHDLQIFMQSFDADAQHRADSRARENQLAYIEGQFNDASDWRHRSALFNDFFGVDTALPLPDGTTLAVENSTITLEDATSLFWRDYTQREKFGFDEALYEVDYQEMMQRLEGQTITVNGEERDAQTEFANSIKGIMENYSLFMQFQQRDVTNPAGHFEALYIRRYQAALEDRREVDAKREVGIVDPAAPSQVAGANPDPDMDVIIPRDPEGTPDDPVTPDALRAMCDELTAASAEVLGAHCAPAAPAAAPPRLR